MHRNVKIFNLESRLSQPRNIHPVSADGPNIQALLMQDRHPDKICTNKAALPAPENTEADDESIVADLRTFIQKRTKDRLVGPIIPPKRLQEMKRRTPSQPGTPTQQQQCLKSCVKLWHANLVGGSFPGASARACTKQHRIECAKEVASPGRGLASTW